MTEPRRFQAVDTLLLLLILAVAFGARAGYLLLCTLPQYPGGWLQVQQPIPPASSQNGTEAKEDPELSELYHNYKAGNGIAGHVPFGDKDKEEVTAYRSPGYPLLLGVLGRVLDDDTLRSWIRWIQAVLGTLTAGVYFLFARRAFRSLTVGTLAGFFCACIRFGSSTSPRWKTARWRRSCWRWVCILGHAAFKRAVRCRVCCTAW